MNHWRNGRAWTESERLLLRYSKPFNIFGLLLRLGAGSEASRPSPKRFFRPGGLCLGSESSGNLAGGSPAAALGLAGCGEDTVALVADVGGHLEGESWQKVLGSQIDCGNHSK